MNRYFLRSWKIILLGSLVCLLKLFLSIRAQLYTGKVLDLAIQQDANLLRSLFFLLLFSIGGIIMGYLLLRCRSRLGQSIVKMLRDDLFSSLLRHDYLDYIKLDRGEVLGLYTKQIPVIEHEFLFMLSWLVEMLLTIFYVLLTLYLLSPFLGIVSIFIFSVPMIMPKLSANQLTKASETRLDKLQEHLAKFNSWLKGFELIKNYGIEEEIQLQFEQSNDEVKGSEKNAERIFAKTTGWSFLCTMSAQTILSLVAAYLVLRGKLSPGDFIVVMGLSAMLKAPIYWVAKLIQSIISTKPVREKVLSFIAYRSLKRKGKEKLSTNNIPTISLNNLSFGYKDEDLLRKLSLDFSPRGHYLILGESGSGKSTLINLLLGNLPQREGEILFNDKELATLENLHDLVTIARQDAVLFDASLYDNLTLFNQEVSKEKIYSVLSALGLGRLANEEGLRLSLHGSGANLSGGEKKRISLARALLRDAPIVILDEPLANIDLPNVDLIEDQLLSLKEKTLIIISHQFTKEKLSHFDGIYTVKGGQIHETLLAKA